MLDTPTTFGDMLRYERELAGFGLRQLAVIIGVSPAYLSRVEGGMKPPPTEDRIRLISEVLDADFFELMGAAGRAPSEVAEHFCRAPNEIMRLLRITDDMSRVEIDRLNDLLEGIVAKLNAGKAAI